MVTKSFNGPVHAHNPYDGFRQGDGPCAEMVGRKRCNQMGTEEVHLRIVNERSPWRKTVTVEVYYQYDPKNYTSGMHVATVVWQSENESSWYSAWMAPHNECSKFRRIEHLDTWNAADIGRWTARLLARDMDDKALKELGIESH